jgi:hypothetical protein
VRGAEKISAEHLQRTAVIYVRQSSTAQVRDNSESTARQYALADEAVRLGWARSQVEVIDADLGLSGRSADGRAGFKDLVGRVCMGEIGAIFGLEVSRLARSSADLSRHPGGGDHSPDGTRRPHWLIRPLRPGREAYLLRDPAERRRSFPEGAQ